MTELDRDSLDRILPRAPGPADWDDVLRRSGARRGRRRAGLVALVVAALVVAGTASALATVRAFFLGTGVNSKIAFMHNTRKNCCPHELWIMNADGSKPERVARDVDVELLVVARPATDRVLADPARPRQRYLRRSGRRER